MTARQPRRARRRAAPAAALPRPTSTSTGSSLGESASLRSAATQHHREHHVTRDYSHIHRDLLTVLGIGVVVIAFIVGMSFVV